MDDDENLFLETMEDPDLLALHDLVTALRMTRMSALRYQMSTQPLEIDAPAGVLEAIQRSEVHLAAAIASLGVSISLEGEIGEQ